MWIPNVRFWSKVIPRYLTALTFGRFVLFITTGAVISFNDFNYCTVPTLITHDVFTFTVNLLSVNH